MPKRNIGKASNELKQLADSGQQPRPLLLDLNDGYGVVRWCAASRMFIVCPMLYDNEMTAMRIAYANGWLLTPQQYDTALELRPLPLRYSGKWIYNSMDGWVH